MLNSKKRNLGTIIIQIFIIEEGDSICFISIGWKHRTARNIRFSFSFSSSSVYLQAISTSIEHNLIYPPLPPHAYNLNRYNIAVTLPVHEYSLCVFVLHFVLQTFVLSGRRAVVMCILNTTISLMLYSRLWSWEDQTTHAQARVSWHHIHFVCIFLCVKCVSWGV